MDNASIVAVTKIPEIQVSVTTTIDWIQLGGIGLTALIVIVGTLATIRNFQKTISSQENISRQKNAIEEEKFKIEVLSKNRQGWINTLRDEVSNYISIINRLHSPFVDQTEARSVLQEATKSKAKIMLLLNPDEPFSEMLASLMNDAILLLEENGANKRDMKDNNIDRMVCTTQIILKEEWERVKNIE